MVFSKTPVDHESKVLNVTKYNSQAVCYKYEVNQFYKLYLVSREMAINGVFKFIIMIKIENYCKLQY